jgi:DNA repair exonuclease SbcCD ATPase subunit
MDELFQLKEKTGEKKRLESQLNKAQNDFNELTEKLRQLKLQLKKEYEDVHKLDEGGLTAFFYSVLGNKVEKIDKERQEYLAVKLKCENCENEINQLEKEINQIKSKLDEAGDPELVYQNLLQSKSALMRNRQDAQFISFETQIENQLRQKKELNEAIEAGEMALKGLRLSIQSLKKALNWGTFDMLGGGLIATAVKHSNIDEAKSVILEVQVWLKKFRRELSDVSIPVSEELTVQLDSFTTFADYFFDSLIFDWVVQNKISRSLDSCESIYKQVTDVVTHLRISDVEITKDYNETKAGFTEYIEKASL